MKVLKDPHDSRRKDELITSSSILIHFYNRCDEVRGKVNRKILHQGKKKTSIRLSDGVTVTLKVITMFKKRGPLAKPEQGVFRKPPQRKGFSQK